MTQLFFFCLEVILGLRTCVDFARYSLDHAQPGLLKRSYLVRVVRQQSNLPDAERLQHLPRHREIAVSALKPRRSFASTVSSPASCNSYAWSLAINPMPRPSFCS